MFLGNCGCGCNGANKGLGELFQYPQPNMDCVPVQVKVAHASGSKGGGTLTKYNCVPAQPKVSAPPPPVQTAPEPPPVLINKVVKVAQEEPIGRKFEHFIPTVEKTTVEESPPDEPVYVGEGKISVPPPTAEEPQIMEAQPEKSGIPWRLILAAISFYYLM